MERKEYFNIYQQEKNHWWYVGMRQIAFSILERYITKKSNILDVGCGTGFNMTCLKRYGNVFGIDNSDNAIQLAKRRGLQIKKASVEQLPFKENSFDIVTCFEVMYSKSIKNDLAAFKEIYHVLKENGVLFIREPAYMFLFGMHDKVVHTKRRYTKTQLEKKLRQAGFKIERMTYVNFLLFPIIAGLKILKKMFRINESDVSETSPFLNKFLSLILGFESHLLKMFNAPFGVSILAVARKNEHPDLKRDQS